MYARRSARLLLRAPRSVPPMSNKTASICWVIAQLYPLSDDGQFQQIGKLLNIEIRLRILFIVEGDRPDADGVRAVELAGLVPDKDCLVGGDAQLLQRGAINFGVRLAHPDLLRRNNRIPDVLKAALFKPVQLDRNRVGGVGDEYPRRKPALFQIEQGLPDAVKETDFIVFFRQDQHAALDLIWVGYAVQTQDALAILVLADLAAVGLLG